VIRAILARALRARCARQNVYPDILRVKLAPLRGAQTTLLVFLGHRKLIY